MTGASVTITKHTTSSTPDVHVVYIVDVVNNGSPITIRRRFSEFAALHSELKDEFPFPAKRLLSTKLFPSAWIDDALISERKLGLAEYLSALLWSSEYQNSHALLDFLKRDTMSSERAADLEDYLPSTLSRKKLLTMMTGEMGDKVDINGTFLSAAYYPSWAAEDVPPESIDYGRYDMIFFGYAAPNSDSTLDWGSDTLPVLKRVIKTAGDDGSGSKIVLAIGGTEGSQWFNHICSSPTNRMTFVAAVVTAVNELGLAGVSIDWETPNLTAFGIPHSPSFATNFLKLLKALRSALGNDKVISAAVSRVPWLGPEGDTSPEVPEFSEQLSYINIMNYGAPPQSYPSAHSSLGSVDDNIDSPSTAEASISAWVASGFPISKILLGIPLFGYVFESAKTGLASGDNWTRLKTSFTGTHKQVAPNFSANDDGSSRGLSLWKGVQIPFKHIVLSGALVKRFDGNYGQGERYTMAWDDASWTPYLFNTEEQTLVVFDNTRSIAAKVHFAKAKGLAGCCTWSLDQDDGYSLQDVILAVSGK